MAEDSDAIQKVLSSHTSDEVMKKLSLKREILSAKKLFEATAQVPSPSKDFTQIIVTEKGMVWRRWKISLRGVSQGAVPQPSEEAMLHEDFNYNSTLQVIWLTMAPPITIMLAVLCHRQHLAVNFTFNIVVMDVIIFLTQNDVERIFGAEVLQRILRILAGSYDDLSLLPDKVLLKICSYLDLQSIAQLSQVNRHLRLICNSDQLWESLYYDHQV